jgi:CHAT domain-containing protein
MVLARLAGSGREISASMRAWGGRSSNDLFLSGADATVGQLRDALARRPAVLHFATHFLQSAGPPPQALLALSLGPDGSPEVLGPAEISRWRQDLGAVVLSGCGSARAGILPAEGLMGMTRAWLAAGAHSVVASIWPTTDDNGDFFVPFYRRLASLKTEPRTGVAAEALRQAQLEMLRSDPWHARPAYWAAYFVVGKE